MNAVMGYGAIMGLLGLATLRWPGAAFGGVICLFGIEEWAQGSDPFFLRHHVLTNLAIGGLVMLGLAVQIFRRRLFSGSGRKLTAWVCLLFAYALVSALWAPRVDLSLNEWAVNWPYLVLEIILAPMLLCRLEDFRDGIATIAILGTALTVLLLYTVKWEYRYIVFAVHGGEVIHGNPLVPAQLAGCTALSALFLKPRRLGWLGMAKWAAVAFCLLLMVRTGSRGQVIGGFLALALAWPAAFRMKSAGSFLALLLGLAFIVGGGFLAYDAYWNTFANRGVGRRWEGGEIGKDISGRLDSAFVLLSHWADDPAAIFVGLGNSASYDPRILGIYPHFVPLEILGEEGLIGFFLFLWIMVLAFRCIRQGFALVKADDRLRGVFGTVYGMFVYSFILSLKQGSMLGTVLLFTFAILLSRFQAVAAREEGALARKKHGLDRPCPAGSPLFGSASAPTPGQA
jgi:hypothetical protein